MTPAQASAAIIAFAILCGCMIVALNIGRYEATVKIRSACDVDDRHHPKAGYYTEVSR